MAEGGDKKAGTGVPDAPTNKSRRFFLKVVATGAAVEAFNHLDDIKNNLEAGSFLVNRLAKVTHNFRDRIGDPTYRLELIQKLFGITGMLHLPVPKEHPEFHRPGPHDLAAMAVPSLMLKNAQVGGRPRATPLSSIDTLFCIGSPNNSAFAQMFIPSTASRRPRLVVRAEALPYHFHQGSSKDLELKSATQDGRVRTVRGHAVMVKGRPMHPEQLAESGTRRLKTDFLLLTVLPWNRRGGRMIVSSGGHGPGTRALQLLVEPHGLPVSELEELVTLAENAPAGFQVVFEVDVQHDGAYSMPATIRISKPLPPIKIDSAASLVIPSDDRMLKIVTQALGRARG